MNFRLHKVSEKNVSGYHIPRLTPVYKELFVIFFANKLLNVLRSLHLNQKTAFPPQSPYSWTGINENTEHSPALLILQLTFGISANCVENISGAKLRL